MKKLFITWLIWLPFSNAAAQFTIYTPNGSTVPNVTINPEMTPAEIAAANDYVDITYPNATRLADASNTYNCHAYSFYLTEGGNTNAWINAFLPTIYWDDGSYTEVTDPRCFSKVTYPVGDHSAVFAGNGQHISKWGPLPLMQHNEDYSPYNSTGLKYYNRNFSISGPNAICATVSDPYIIPALPPGTYSVQVRAFKNGQWCTTNLPWGDVCNVTITGTQSGSGMATVGGAELFEASLALFPNPNNGDQLTVSLSAVEDGVRTVSVDIFDMNGARVSSQTLAVNDGRLFEQVAVNDLASGLYMVNITAGGKRYTERLVISK
ncbi:MAG TPA: T9SS type A sorting domain-containing protein [Chitinophagaceae bacterium]|nr:T9SS type A sorting domain-containing protein [Chitinophagaceae bacterium]